jgi:hypothetical protein
LGALLGLLVGVPSIVLAEPLNLSEARPREVVVRFEVSPREVPAQLKTT